MKILFVCKYNRFRSKVAEAYFKTINKNKSILAEGVGFIKVDKKLDSKEKKRNFLIKKNFGIAVKGRSIGMKGSLLVEADKIIVVADDVPKMMFNYRLWKDKVEIWKSKDEDKANEQNINKIVKFIISKVNKLVNDLK